MVYLPGAINVADIMDSGLSYGLIFLRNYILRFYARERRRDSIAERSRVYIRAPICDVPSFRVVFTLPSRLSRPNLDPVFLLPTLVRNIGFFTTRDQRNRFIDAVYRLNRGLILCIVLSSVIVIVVAIETNKSKKNKERVKMLS